MTRGWGQDFGNRTFKNPNNMDIFESKKILGHLGRFSTCASFCALVFHSVQWSFAQKNCLWNEILEGLITSFVMNRIPNKSKGYLPLLPLPPGKVVPLRISPNKCEYLRVTQRCYHDLHKCFSTFYFVYVHYKCDTTLPNRSFPLIWVVIFSKCFWQRKWM